MFNSKNLFQLGKSFQIKAVLPQARMIRINMNKFHFIIRNNINYINY